jgi:hypothetical protein
MDSVSETREVQKVIDRLTGRFPDTSPIEISAVVHEEHDKLAESRIRDFIPVLVEHEARDRLRASGHIARPREDEATAQAVLSELQG